jgi:cell division protein FtsZ
MTLGRITFAADESASPARITVVGVGGGGGNAVSRMIDAGLQGVKFVTLNTDAQALWSNRSMVKVQIGEKVTNGLGAGADPNVGRQAAVEDSEKISEALEGSDMVFITTGLGGGTGTGAAPVVASIAGRLGNPSGNGNQKVLTVAVVTMPFGLEGNRRMAVARNGLSELLQCVDSVIVIPNDRLLQTTERNTPVYEAFSLADDVLLQAVQGITDLILLPGHINVDFADVRTVMMGMGHAMMGIGIGEGPLRALQAAQRSIANPLLEDASIQGARGIIVNVTGGPDLSLSEASEATGFITRVADPEATVIYGIVTSENMGKAVKVTVIATGFERAARTASTPLGGITSRGGFHPQLQPKPLPATEAVGHGPEHLPPPPAPGNGQGNGQHRVETGVSGIVSRLRGEWRRAGRQSG